VIVAGLGVALAAAWVFTPILMSKDSASTAGLFSKTKPRPPAQDPPVAPTLASVQATPAATPVAPTAPPDPDTTATVAASTDDQTAAAPGPVVASATATPWPQSRSLQADANATPAPANGDTMQVAAVVPQDTPAEPFDNVPLPRKRPSRLIEASLTIPLPRPRPEIESDTPPELSAFERQVERMR
jgi:hypothetical protein